MSDKRIILKVIIIAILISLALGFVIGCQGGQKTTGNVSGEQDATKVKPGAKVLFFSAEW